MKRRAYEKRLKELQEALNLLQQAMVRQRRSGIVVFEGWDAAGKGSVIRRIAWCLDPRTLRVRQIGAPNEAERRQHWLQRFWTGVPQSGEIALFDRSWYGRILVERVEGFAEEAAWQRAYDEIVAFERSLVDEGFRLVKLFLDITPETQLERFRSRFETPAKRWKLTEEDIRNRARRDDYARAYAEAFERTSIEGAPWHRVDMNDKLAGRIACFELILAELGRGVDIAPPDVPPAVATYFEQR